LKILVLGLGNDLYGDDGVGFHIVRILRAEEAGEHPGPERTAGVKGRAFGSPLARGLYPRASTAEVDPRAKPGAPAGAGVRAKAPAPAAVDFVECPVSGLALLDVILGYDALVIVDTIVRPDAVPGRVHLLEGRDLRDFPGPSPHYVSIPQTLALGRQLGLRMPRIVKIVAVEAEDPFRLGEGLSVPMARRLPDIVAATRSILQTVAAGLD